MLVPGADRQAPTARRVQSVPELITVIEVYLDAHNNDPKPFTWSATAEDILAKVARGREPSSE